MKFDFSWNRALDDIAEDSSSGRQGLLFLANEARRLMNPYVPADSLVLAQNVRTYVDGGKGIVHYQSPYAHYQYMGIVYGPNYPIKDGGTIMGYYSPPNKTSTGRKMQHSAFRHPLATSEWDKAMMRSRKGDLVSAYEAYLKGSRL